VLDAVAALDLGGFRRRYRADGHGRAASGPEMMVALLLYGYCQGERSSRVIEKRCVRDVTYRVIAGGLHPDHATIARFRARHEKALGELFSQVLRLLAAEGMVSLGTLSAMAPSWPLLQAAGAAGAAEAEVFGVGRACIVQPVAQRPWHMTFRGGSRSGGRWLGRRIAGAPGRAGLAAMR